MKNKFMIKSVGEAAIFGAISGAILAMPAAYDIFAHKVQLNQVFHAHALSHSAFGYEVDASSPEAGNEEFIMDNRDVNVGECFKPTVGGYYTKNAFFFLDMPYSTDHVEIVPCPSRH